MIVLGGFNDDPPFITVFNDGGKYNPSTDSWTATSMTNPPSERYWHTAVWTGSEMIIWGGFGPGGGNGFSGSLNTGGNTTHKMAGRPPALPTHPLPEIVTPRSGLAAG